MTKESQQQVLHLNIDPSELAVEEVGPGSLNLVTGVVKPFVAQGAGVNRVAQPAYPFRQLMVLMERPFFALSKRGASAIEYTSPDNKISVHVEGEGGRIASVYDAECLIYLVSQIAQWGRPLDNTLKFQPGAYFAAVGAKSGGDQYRLLRNAVERLSATTVTTNARPDGSAGPATTFRWIEAKSFEDNGWLLTLSDWIVEGASSKFVLSVCPEYFSLPGYERFLYFCARKHVGRDIKKSFAIGLPTLWKKSGSSGPMSRFRHAVKSIALQNTLPEYLMQWREGHSSHADIVFSWRGKSWENR